LIAQRLVSLTFDGTTIGHLEVVAPLLRRLGLSATFYACSENLLRAVRDWQEVAAAGFEIGEGCLISAARSDGYVPLTRTAIAAELEASAELLEGLFPGPRSFGFPWGAPSCVDGDYRDLVAGRYDLARAGMEGRNTKTATDFAFLRCLPCEGYSGPELIDLAENGLAAEEWVIFAFCGVGEGERAVDLGAFTALAEHLARTDAPCASVVEGAGLWRRAMAAL
jgi:peptidoglycan/xylan/chitin deacetylase (PgdA/CDA1 family)